MTDYTKIEDVTDYPEQTTFNTDDMSIIYDDDEEGE